jgi:hypothetical protein
MTAKRYYTFMIDPTLLYALKTLKQRDGISESEQIRRALRDWFRKKRVAVEADRQRAATRQRS